MSSLGKIPNIQDSNFRILWHCLQFNAIVTFALGILFLSINDEDSPGKETYLINLLFCDFRRHITFLKLPNIKIHSEWKTQLSTFIYSSSFLSSSVFSKFSEYSTHRTEFREWNIPRTYWKRNVYQYGIHVNDISRILGKRNPGILPSPTAGNLVEKAGLIWQMYFLYENMHKGFVKRGRKKSIFQRDVSDILTKYNYQFQKNVHFLPTHAKSLTLVAHFQ